jgi:hypothetical protein
MQRSTEMIHPKVEGLSFLVCFWPVGGNYVVVDGAVVRVSGVVLELKGDG